MDVTWVHTLVVGSGAAGLATAVQLRAQGVEDICILTEGLEMGTSINTGSDKQTYYKLSLCDHDADSPRDMCDTYVAGGSMHGDLALVEATCSVRAFLKLVDLGMPFPRDPYGQFVGYKTDHDPRRRATSIGPYTSREMCRTLIREVARLGIPVAEGHVVSRLVVSGTGTERRAVGVVATDPDGMVRLYGAENIVFAVGGPGGLYRTSVYPAVHTGAIGVAMAAGVRCQGLSESQYGMASIGFRWNVSGTYMQVVPRFISTDADGGDVREFLDPYLPDAGARDTLVFLKGYQWPFDARKATGGSSLIDILVYVETVLRGRRVYLDYRSNPVGFAPQSLGAEALDYLTASHALLPTPFERLAKMNPRAIELYRDHGIDLASEPLEIAVCAQHNNGGLAATCWWESENTAHLFPVGEVNGSHGVYRPGGSALNSGQVGAIRAAERIAHCYAAWTVDRDAATQLLEVAADEEAAWLAVSARASRSWYEHRDELQGRMSRVAAHIRDASELERALEEARTQLASVQSEGCRPDGSTGVAEALCTRQLCVAHVRYIEAVQFALASGVGSRGSAIALDPEGEPIHSALDGMWRIRPEDESFRRSIMVSEMPTAAPATHRWEPVREVPQSDTWFETAWAAFNAGEIYNQA